MNKQEKILNMSLKYLDIPRDDIFFFVKGIPIDWGSGYINDSDLTNEIHRLGYDSIRVKLFAPMTRKSHSPIYNIEGTWKQIVEFLERELLFRKFEVGELEEIAIIIN